MQISNPPQKLYVLGNEKLLKKKSLAIVGSRHCTEYGYKQAEMFSREISKHDICIVSGMALGIDSSAHNGAKKEIGKTIAVLGSGFNNIFPKENEELFYEILKNGGCIISEYAPDVKKNSKYFPIRNRIISGLSEGALIVEAKEKSGSGITARIANQQNKKVYCIPSNIDSVNGIGTGRLIQKGAKLVLNPKDILIDFGINEICENNFKDETNVKVDKKYMEVYKILSKLPININEICKKTKKDIGEINMTLTMLELEGVIKQVGANEFIKI